MSSFGGEKREIDQIRSASDYVRYIIPHEEMVSLDQFKPLIKWWQSIHNEYGYLPSRKDFNPVDFSTQLPNISILEPVYEGSEITDYMTSLIGTNLTKVYGETTGVRASQIGNEYVAETVLATCGQCIQQRQPLAVTAKALSKDLPFMRSFALYLPLASDHQTIDKIMVYIFFEKSTHNGGAGL